MNGEQIMIYPYNEVMHINIRELTVDTHNIDESQNHYPYWKKLDTMEYILYDSTYVKLW